MSYRASIIAVLLVYLVSVGYLVASAIHGDITHIDWAALVVVVSAVILTCNAKEVIKIISDFFDEE